MNSFAQGHAAPNWRGWFANWHLVFLRSRSLSFWLCQLFSPWTEFSLRSRGALGSPHTPHPASLPLPCLPGSLGVSVNLRFHVCTCLSVCIPVFLCVSVHACVCVSLYVYVSVAFYVAFCMYLCLSVFLCLSVYLCLSPSLSLCTSLPVFLCVCLWGSLCFPLGVLSLCVSVSMSTLPLAMSAASLSLNQGR